MKKLDTQIRYLLQKNYTPREVFEDLRHHYNEKKLCRLISNISKIKSKKIYLGIRSKF